MVSPLYRAGLCSAALALSFHAAQAQTADPMLLHDADGLTVRAHLQFGLNAVSEQNVFWSLSDVTAPGSGFDPDTDWLEGYVKGGLSFTQDLDTGGQVFGKVSAVASYTAGTDAFDRGNTGATTMEEYHLGLRGPLGADTRYEVSLGARELVLGTGMLVANGATSGFERGALKFGPRKAWERALIAKLEHKDLTGTLFFLDPNELPSTDSGTTLAGIDLRRDPAGGGYIGATLVTVPTSGSSYPQAAPGGIGAPTITPGAREGTTALNIYGRTAPLTGALENWTFSGDVAIERNGDIDLQAWAGRVTAGYTFAGLPWSPTLTYGFQTFSGDDPATPELERFDPLFYQGSPSAWATGSKAASTYLNSNVNAHTLTLAMRPTQRDTVTLRYAHIRANELNSPVQFGQGTRVDASGNLVAGVTTPHLSDDLFLEYSRIINRNTFLTAGFSVSFPGAGIDDVVGGPADTWTGGFLNVVFNF